MVDNAPPYASPVNPALAAFTGDLLTVTADAPLPPGTRVALDLPLPRTGGEIHVAGKVIGAAPDAAGRSRLTIRLHSTSRETRHALTAEAAS